MLNEVPLNKSLDKLAFLRSILLEKFWSMEHYRSSFRLLRFFLTSMSSPYTQCSKSGSTQLLVGISYKISLFWVLLETLYNAVLNNVECNHCVHHLSLCVGNFHQRIHTSGVLPIQDSTNIHQHLHIITCCQSTHCHCCSWYPLRGKFDSF